MNKSINYNHLTSLVLGLLCVACGIEAAKKLPHKTTDNVVVINPLPVVDPEPASGAFKFNKTLAQSTDTHLLEISANGEVELKLSDADNYALGLLQNVGEALELDLAAIQSFQFERNEKVRELGTGQVACEMRHVISKASPIRKARIKLVDHLSDMELVPSERRHEYALELNLNRLVDPAANPEEIEAGYRKGMLNFRFENISDIKGAKLRAFFGRGYSEFHTCADFSTETRINTGSTDPVDRL